MTTADFSFRPVRVLASVAFSVIALAATTASLAAAPMTPPSDVDFTPPTNPIIEALQDFLEPLHVGTGCSCIVYLKNRYKWSASGLHPYLLHNNDAAMSARGFSRTSNPGKDHVVIFAQGAGFWSQKDGKWVFTRADKTYGHAGWLASGVTTSGGFRYFTMQDSNSNFPGHWHVGSDASCNDLHQQKVALVSTSGAYSYWVKNRK